MSLVNLGCRIRRFNLADADVLTDDELYRALRRWWRGKGMALMREEAVKAAQAAESGGDSSEG